jgi:hypothetical protein
MHLEFPHLTAIDSDETWLWNPYVVGPFKCVWRTRDGRMRGEVSDVIFGHDSCDLTKPLQLRQADRSDRLLLKYDVFSNGITLHVYMSTEEIRTLLPRCLVFATILCFGIGI